jgi:ornithine--oxo-acid transaminase
MAIAAPSAAKDATSPTAVTAGAGPALLQLRDQYVAPAFFQVTPVVVARAEGAWLTDVDGKRYLDFAAGIGALPLARTIHGRPGREANASQRG